MITREELAEFILQVADGNYSKEDWVRIAVNHYSDERIEEARRKLVRYVLGYPPPADQAQLSLKQLLSIIAAELRSDEKA